LGKLGGNYILHFNIPHVRKMPLYNTGWSLWAMHPNPSRRPLLEGYENLKEI